MKPSDKSDANSASSNVNDSTNPPNNESSTTTENTGPNQTTGTNNNKTYNNNSSSVTAESSDSTPLSTAPTSPISQSSLSYKSGILTDSNVAQGLQSIDDEEPQLSERAAYGEQVVGDFCYCFNELIFMSVIFLCFNLFFFRILYIYFICISNEVIYQHYIRNYIHIHRLYFLFTMSLYFSHQIQTFSVCYFLYIVLFSIELLIV